LFDNQPDSVVWFVPIFDAGNQSIPFDFVVKYCNNAACQILNATKHEIIGSGLRPSSLLMDATSRQTILNQCMEIWESGVKLEFTYYSPGLKKHFNVQRSKIQNGILSITRDHTTYVKEREEKELQSKLLNQIIETSVSGISLYEAIRNKEGDLIDFKLRLANQKCSDITGFRLADLTKYTVKELMLLRGNPEFFTIVSKVVNTGEPIYMEYFSLTQKRWTGLHIQKFDDGYLLNYTDISHTKNLEEKAQNQADLLQGILNTSITGLITLEAQYSPAGKYVEDFKFILLNDASKKILGLKDGDEKKSYLTLFPNAKTNGFFDLHVNTLTTGIPVSKEFFYKGDGYNGWYYLSVSRMNATTLVQSFDDITHTRVGKN
jgi:PAS domain-containing protein